MAVIPRGRLVPVLAGVGAAIAVGVGGAVWWTDRQHFEATDNAFVEADKVQVAPQVEGYVAELAVGDNETVGPGQLLLRIDPSQIRARLAQAQANAAALDAGVRQVDDKARLEEAMIAQRDASLKSAMAQAKWTASERERFGTLAAKGWVSPQQAQNARTAADQADAAVTQAQATLEAERRTAQSLGSARAQTVAQTQAARAAVEQAQIDLAHTEIRSPIAGVVGARGVRIGQYVRAGGALMSIVPVADSYVVANFKETQVARLRIGQPVEIRADAFGDRTLRGRLVSFAPATGQEFAIIPVENAVGNFTKIAQRLPVKIAIDRDQPLSGALRPGLSVEVKVDVRPNTGPSFAEAGTVPIQYARSGEAR